MLYRTGNAELDRLIARQVRYGQTRRMEVLLASLMMAVGATLLLPGDTFALPSFRVISHILSETKYGYTATVFGSLRLWAIWMNGRRNMPALRLLGCAVGFLFWLGWAGGFAMTAPPFVPLEAMSMVLMFFEISACRLVTRDFYADNSLGLRRAMRNAGT